MVEIVVACITLGSTLISGFFLIIRYLNQQNSKLTENVRMDSLTREQALLDIIEDRTGTIEAARKEMTVAFHANTEALTSFRALLKTVAFNQRT